MITNYVEIFDMYQAATGCDDMYFYDLLPVIDNNYEEMIMEASRIGCRGGDYFSSNFETVDGFVRLDDIQKTYHYNHDLLLWQANDVLPFAKAGDINYKELCLWWDTWSKSGQALFINYPAYGCGDKILMIVKAVDKEIGWYDSGFRFVWIEDRPIAECVEDYYTGD